MSVAPFITASGDQTDAVQAALAYQSAHGGGAVVLPPRRFTASVALSTNEIDNVALLGEHNGTVIVPANPGEFGVRTKNDQFQPPPWVTTLVRDLAVDGGEDGDRCGFFFPRRANVENVKVRRAPIAMMFTDQYYGGGRNIDIGLGFVGMLFGTYGAGNEVLTDLRDAHGNALSITLPEPSRSSNGHSGNKYFSTVRIDKAPIGVALLGYTRNPMITIEHLTCEHFDIGVLVTRGDLVLRQPWFEAGGTGDPITFNGDTYPQSAIVVSRGRHADGIGYEMGGRCIVDGGLVPSAHVEDGGTLILRGFPQIATDRFTVETGGSLIIESAQASSIALPHVVDRPRPMYNTGHGLTCWSRPKTQRVWGVRPKGGRVLIGEDFTGTDFRSQHLSIIREPEPWQFGASGGLFADQKCLMARQDASTALKLHLNDETAPLIQNGKFYAILLAVKPDAPTRIYWDAVVMANPTSPTLPAGEWTTICFNAQLDNSQVPGQYHPRLACLDLTETTSVFYGGLNVVEFDNPHDLAEFCAEQNLYMSEAA